MLPTNTIISKEKNLNHDITFITILYSEARDIYNFRKKSWFPKGVECMTLHKHSTGSLTDLEL